MSSTVSEYELLRIINADHNDPFGILGMHKVKSDNKKSPWFSVRVFNPDAKSIKITADDGKSIYEMDMVHEKGFFEAIIKDRSDYFFYSLEVETWSENKFITYDPYCFLPIISDYDLYLFNEGNQHRIYEKLGAHIMHLKGVEGTHFAVWAPNAKRVSAVGSFNNWDGRRHQMRSLGKSGVWEIFIPGVRQGDLYKFEIKTSGNELYIKADPYAFRSELRPNTASVVHSVNPYEWNDLEWIKSRNSSAPYDKPVSIYEVHLGSWARVPEEGNRFLTYGELADALIDYVKDMGYTHIELLPVAEHPFDGSWGYQITGYYSITSRYGSPDDFKFFVDKCHQNGIGVILDWVPAHFPKDGHGIARFDGTALYEHHNPKQGEHPDWGTHIFNYGRNEVKNFMISNALFLFDVYHVDGLRVDAVASMLYLDYGKKEGEWVPNKWGGKENIDAIDFMKQLNYTVYKHHPGIMMIAEESTSWAMVTKPPYNGGLGFSFKWNMGWMNDFLRYMSMDPIYRKYHQNDLTFSIMYAYSENFQLVLSHDEAVHGKGSIINKMPGDYWQKFAGLRASYGYMYGHPGKKLLFMGGEFGQLNEWNYMQSLDWHLLDYDNHKKLQAYVRDLNMLYKNEKSLYQLDYSYEGFEWIDCSDSEHSVLSFMRKSREDKDILIFICNFTPRYHFKYRIGVPYNMYYKEILNSDAKFYGGGNTGNLGGVQAEKMEFHNRPYSIEVQLPALSVIVLKPENNNVGCYS